jgi:hypothetical protein
MSNPSSLAFKISCWIVMIGVSVVLIFASKAQILSI